MNPNPLPVSSEDDDFINSSASAAWTKLDVGSIQEEITTEVFKRYRYKLDDTWWNECKCIVLLRELCLKMGFQLKAREYVFEKLEKTEAVNGNGKSKKAVNGANGHKSEDVTFHPEDVLNVVPVVKDAPLKVTCLEHKANS